MKHSSDDIRSAHEKQRRKYLGEGGVVFTEAEQRVIDNHIPLEDAEKD